MKALTFGRCIGSVLAALVGVAVAIEMAAGAAWLLNVSSDAAVLAGVLMVVGVVSVLWATAYVQRLIWRA